MTIPQHHLSVRFPCHNAIYTAFLSNWVLNLFSPFMCKHVPFDIPLFPYLWGHLQIHSLLWIGWSYTRHAITSYYLILPDIIWWFGFFMVFQESWRRERASVKKSEIASGGINLVKMSTRSPITVGVLLFYRLICMFYYKMVFKFRSAFLPCFQHAL